ncbi:MAG: GMC family oxidoreductase [Sphingobacteriales bacterium]|nr:GMC family oxidoreductase [Sphingobacteriales bacterium]
MPDSTSVYINTKGVEQNTYDAIVVGSGISGGWAAKELCEKGLKTLVLERGRNVEHIKDYPTANLSRWELPHRGDITQDTRKNNPFISRAAGYDEATQHFFVKDAEHPYVQEKPFEWVRGYQVGGKSLTWGRACARWSPFDFTAPERYGYGMSFPIGYDDIKDWYSHVEKFIGVCGNKEGIPSMPDGEFLPAYELNMVEQHLQKVIKEKFNRHYVSGRWAHITEPQPIHKEQGRIQCLNRNACMRGCPLGGYFSSVSCTLPWANKTGNLTIRPFSVVNVEKRDTDFFGGYVIYSGASRSRYSDAATKEVVGAEFKEALSEAGPWAAYMYMQGETIAKETNHVRLSTDKKDQWGIPLLITSVGYDENDDKMVKDFLEQGQAMLEAAGVKNISTYDSHQAPGLDIHEMGGVRMGKDPKNSILNEFNQLHHCKNVFVTDGACMTSTGSQSPSILYMAFTARAVNHAVEEMKKRNL